MDRSSNEQVYILFTKPNKSLQNFISIFCIVLEESVITGLKEALSKVSAYILLEEYAYLCVSFFINHKQL